MNGYISAKLAQNVTGFCNEDLDMLWRAILNMFGSSIVLRHAAIWRFVNWPYSNTVAHLVTLLRETFDSIDVHKRDGVDVARSFGDYEVHEP